MSVAVKLRLAAALLHAAPDARATLRCLDGRLFLAGGHPACDLSATELRALALDAARDEGRRAGFLADLDLCGGVEPLGAGLYRRRAPSGVEERWFASTLPAPMLQGVLGQRSGGSATGALEARICPDPAVEACAVCLRPRPSGPTAGSASPPEGRPDALAFDALAFDLLAGCLVAELVDGCGG
ncbi:MAG: hypothetical protein IT196_14770 [Acidimicrobiales bacterium]|nr:hypothetical protein [Acidimicrobiales bacterium]